jgi:ABC-type glycerol-3-phosphate transport system permease component
MAADVPFERLLAAAGVIAMLPAVLVALVANKHIRGMLPGSHDPSPPISQRS